MLKCDKIYMHGTTDRQVNVEIVIYIQIRKWFFGSIRLNLALKINSKSRNVHFLTTLHHAVLCIFDVKKKSFEYVHLNVKVYWISSQTLILFPMGSGLGVSQPIQTISFQTRIELYGWKLHDNIISTIPHILEKKFHITLSNIG